MKKLIKGLIFTVVIVALLGVLGVLIYLTYVSSNSEEAKKYLVETYKLNEKNLNATKYTEYVYEDIADCSSLWLKECTDNANLVAEFTFKYDNKEIVVYEDKDGNYTDNYGDNKE